MRFTARVPATTANLGLGFDCIGLAMSWFDELTLGVSDTGGISIEATGKGAHQVPRDEFHFVVTTLLHALRQWGTTPPDGLVLRARNTIPYSHGLDSSAVAMVAGCALTHGITFLGRELNRAELAWISSPLEGHPDNTDVVVWGGAILAQLDEERVELIRLRSAERLRCLASVPDLEILATSTRAVPPDVVAQRDAAIQAIAVTSLFLALEQRPDLLLPITRGQLHQFHRSELTPTSWTLLRRLWEVGVSATIFEVGPTMFAVGMKYQLAMSKTVEHEGLRRHDLGIGGGVQLPD